MPGTWQNTSPDRACHNGVFFWDRSPGPDCGAPAPQDASAVMELIPSEDDRRVKLLQYTERGRILAEQAAEDFVRIEQELANVIGQDDLEELRRILSKPWSSDLPDDL